MRSARSNRIATHIASLAVFLIAITLLVRSVSGIRLTGTAADEPTPMTVARAVDDTTTSNTVEDAPPAATSIPEQPAVEPQALITAEPAVEPAAIVTEEIASPETASEPLATVEPVPPEESEPEVVPTVAHEAEPQESLSATDETPPPIPPAPGFEVSPQEILPAAAVSIVNTTTGDITTWAWDFGDGTTSTERDPGPHTYVASGTYTITLSVTGPAGSGTATRQVVVLESGGSVEADFSFVQGSGLEVCFTSHSTGDIASHAWDFGDGATGGDANPCHTYAVAGIYSISLKVTGVNSAETSTATQTVSVVPQDPPPMAAFTVSDPVLYVGDALDFFDESTGLITTWAWDLGDGTTSAARSPHHEYLQAGTYTVTLTVTGPGGSSQASATVTVIELPVDLFCDFNAPAHPFSGTSYTLDGRVSNAGDSTLAYEWTVNGEVIGAAEDASYRFPDAGEYTITFTVTPNQGTPCSRTRTLTAIGDDGAVAGFDRSPASGLPGTEVCFTDASVGTITAWSWDFGDGAASSEQNPCHVYTNIGRYTATLTVTAGDETTSSASAKVNILAEQSLAIEASPLSGFAPLIVQFSAQSETIDENSLEWTFPGDVKAYGTSAVYTFRQAGTYTVTLTGSGPLGEASAATTIEVSAGSGLRAGFTLSRWQGIIPLEVCFTDTSRGANLSAWSWNFGNDESSTEQNPCVTYTQPGTYDVILMVTNAAGQNATATNRIRALSVSGSSTVITVTPPSTEVPAEPSVIHTPVPPAETTVVSGDESSSGAELVGPVESGGGQNDALSIEVMPEVIPVQSSILPGSGSGEVNAAAAPYITLVDPALSKAGILPAGSTGLPGEQLIWHVTATNVTALDETNIVITDTIRNDLKIDRVTADAGVDVTYTGQVVTATIATLTPGQSLNFYIHTTVLSSPLNGLFTNTAYPNIGQPASATVNVPPASINQPHPHVDGLPDVSVFGGEQVCFTAAFTNTGAPGYGPYLLLVLPPGVTFNTATFMTGTVVIVPTTRPSPDNGQWVDPVSGQLVNVPIGGTLVVFRLPIGSVVEGNPSLNTEVCVTPDPLAPIGVPLPLVMYPAYEFGSTPTGDNGSIVGIVPDNGSITPILVTFDKTENTPEAERPPGPSWPYEYTLTAELAPGQTLTNVVFRDVMPNWPDDELRFQYTGPTVLGGTCVRGATTITPPTPGNGHTLMVSLASLTEPTATQTCIVTVTYTGYILDILDESGGTNQADVTNDATFDYDHATLPSPQLSDTTTISAEHLLFQKAVTPGVVIPGNIVTYTVDFQVTDYGTADSVILVDTMPDGLDFVAGSGTVSIPGFSGPITPTITPNANGTLTLRFDVLAAAGLPTIPGGSTGTLTYRASVQQVYRNGGQPVRASDVLANTIQGNYHLTDEAVYQDDSDAQIVIQPITLQKQTVTTPRNSVGFVHGESVRFRLTMTIPSGDTRGIVIEDFFPLPVFNVTSSDYGLRTGVPGAMPFLNPDGFCSTYPTAQNPTYERCGIYVGPNSTLPGLLPSSITVNPATNSIQISVPDITTTAPQILEFDIVIAIVDQPFADNLFLANMSRATTLNTPGEELRADAIDYVRVAAPDLQIVKGVLSSSNPNGVIAPVTNPVNGDLTRVDAGDQVNYQITVDNVGGARAYNVLITDIDVPGLTGCTLVAGSVRNGAGTTLAYSGDLNTGIQLTGPVPGGRGASAALARVLLNVTCTLDVALSPGDEVVNRATVTWTAIEDGSGQYPLRYDNAYVTIIEPELDKSILSTGETFTTGNNVAVGELIRYRVDITVPEGTTHNAVLVDTLDTGLALMDLTDATLTSLTLPAGVTSSQGDAAAILNAAIVTGSGRTVTIHFGTLTNSNDSNTTPEIIRLEYTVVVLNSSGVTRGTRWNNAATLTFETDGSIGDAAPNVTVVEPLLRVVKTPNPASGDADDVITFTVVISHQTPPSNAGAFDITLSDPIPAGMTYIAGTLTHTAGVAPAALTESGGIITGTWDALLLGQSSTFTYQVRLGSTVQPGTSITNIATAGYDSLPGDDVVDRSPYNNQSDERDYSVNGSATVNIILGTLTKAVTATSVAATGSEQFNPALPDLNLGEEVTYTLVLTLSEGTVTSAQLRDTLPTGLNYVSHTFTAGSSLTIGGSTTPVIAGGVLTWNLGTVTNPADNFVDDRDRIIVAITAVVANIPSNVNGTVRTNTTTFQAATGTPLSATADVEIVEPALLIDKSSPTTGGDAGDEVLYTVVISHAPGSASDAYDLVITDALLPQLILVTPNQVTTSAGTVVTGNTAGDTTIRVEVPTLVRGASVTITYRARLADTVSAGQTLINTARISYDDKAGSGVRTSSGSDSHTVTVTAPQFDKTIVATSFSGTGSAQHVPAHPDLAMGETVTYELVIEIPEGRSPIVITDNLPAGMHVLSSEVTSIGGDTTAGATSGGTIADSALAVGASGTGADTNGDGLLDRVVFDFGTLTNTPNGASSENDRIRVRLTARLMDVAANANGQTKTNTATLNYGAGTLNASRSADVVEPVVTLTKAFVPPVRSVGAMATMTLQMSNNSAADAFELRLTDTINSVLRVDSISVNTVGTAGTTFVDNSTTGFGGVVDISFNQLLRGETVTVTVTLSIPDNLPTQVIPNTANLGYDDLPVSSPDNDFDRNSTTSSSASLTVNRVIDLALTKTVDISLPYPGDTVVYTLSVTSNGPAGATNVQIVDTLPAGLTFVSATTPVCSYTAPTVTCAFGNVPAGTTHTVTITALVNSGTAGTTLTNAARTFADESGVNYSNESNPNNNAAGVGLNIQRLASVGDLLWYDTNFNGIAEAGEAGIANVTVQLLNSGGTVIASATTNGSGLYIFDNLKAGTYSVRVVAASLPAGAIAFLDTFDGNRDNLSTFTITAGQVLNTADFAYIRAGTIGDMIWRDSNSNNVQDGLEFGIGGVTLTLTGTDAFGAAVNRMTSSLAGVYSFASVLPGNYTVSINPATLPPNLIPGYDLDGASTPHTAVLTLLSGQTRSDVDFGYRPVSLIGDRVWNDGDGDGLQEAGEPGIPGITVTITGTPLIGPAVNRTAVTGADGIYTFTNLETGWYSVTVTPPAGLTPSFDLDGVRNNQTWVFLSDGQQRTDVDFGYMPAGSVGDRVWHDSDADGVQEAGEIGLSGITVSLYGYDNFFTPVNLTTTTDSDGNYLFSNVPAGNYTVSIFTPPAGTTPTYDLNGGRDNTTTVPLTAGQNRTDVDFGYVRWDSIGDRVWRDLDGDGVQDTGEPGIFGVWLNLTGTNTFGQTINSFVQTDFFGNYLFNNLIPGNYTVSILTAYLPFGVAPSYDLDGIGTPHTTAVALTSGGQNRTDVDFGYVPTGSIGDFVWNDLNGNGVFNAGEPGFAGVTVNLTGTDVYGNAVSRTTTTNASGIYTFSNVESGTYTITIPIPPAGTAPSFDLDFVRDNRTTVFLAAGQNRTDVDFGYMPGASIGDRVWRDLDGDGIQDGGEPGISGATITLTGTNTFGAFVSLTTTTDANGIYTFSNLAPAFAYTVTVTTPPAGTIPSYNLDPVRDNTTTVSLAAGQTRTDVDFGYVPTGSIGDRVWRDIDNDGVQDAGEPGIFGVLMQLSGTNIYGGSVSQFVSTGADGSYNFTAVPPGTNYTVTIWSGTLPFGVTPSYDLDGTGTPHVASLALNPGQTRTDVDFGYAPSGSIGDRIWRDINGNGVQEGSETGYTGITLTLTGTDAYGNAVSRTTFTGANGMYLFSNVEASNAAGYVITVTTPPAGTVSSYEFDGIRNNATLLVFFAGQNVTWIDFGYLPLSSIGDLVWRDTDGNGVQNAGEAGVSGVTVSLTGTDIFGQAVSRTTTTDANGNYVFNNVVMGSYFVRLTAGLPADTQPGYDLDGGRDNQTFLFLTGGTSRTNIDFGLLPLGSIGDRVWLDADGDGIQDAAETGIQNVTLQLSGTDILGQFVFRTTTTGVNGIYTFNNLVAGTYTVSVTAGAPVGSTPSFDVDGVPNGSASVTLIGGTNRTDVDFGYAFFGSIGDTVWLDTSGNGLQDGSEPGLGGIVVQLIGTDTLGNPVNRTTFTSASGFYQFTQLVAGTYTVVINLSQAGLTGLSPTYDPDMLLDGMTTIVLAPGQNVTTADFGFNVAIVLTLSGDSGGGAETFSLALSPLAQEMTANAQTPGVTALPNLGQSEDGAGVIPEPLITCPALCPVWQLYHSNRTGTWQIYRLNPTDGLAYDPNVSNSSANDYAPSRSPDNQWMVFSSDRDGNRELYIAPLNGDTSLVQRVTFNTLAIDTDPVWGPNQYIVFESSRDGNWNLFLFDVITGQEMRLTDHPASDINAFWSPDGSKIVFQSSRSGQWQIYELDLTTMTTRLLSDGTGNDLDPAYSSDGTQIAFRSIRNGQKSTIYIMNADGSNLHAISDPNGTAQNQSWSMNNELIAYQSDLDGDNDIYIYELLTGRTRKLTDNTIEDYAPTWNCGSNTVLFNSDVNGNPNIFQAEALPITAPPIDVKTKAVPLIIHPADDLYPQDMPAEENASREGRMPDGLVADTSAGDYIQPQVNPTPPEPPQPRDEPWNPIELSCLTEAQLPAGGGNKVPLLAAAETPLADIPSSKFPKI